MEKIDLLQFVPSEMRSGRLGNTYPLKCLADEEFLSFNYIVSSSNQVLENCGERLFAVYLPRFINRDQRTFEVLGLLQAEMNKHSVSTLVFANCEPNIINLVMDWFKEELRIDYPEWNWYIRLNYIKPENPEFRDELEENLIEFWLRNSSVLFDLKYTVSVSYLKATKNEIAANDGTLMIEFSSTIVAQFMQNILTKFQSYLLTCDSEEIGWYMRGILAGESCIELNRKIKKFAVRISASKLEERQLFQICLKKLDIELKLYENYTETVISRKANLIRVRDLNLLSLNPTKYAKFLEMMSCYQNSRQPEIASF
ncbi:MAG: hypothetical protein AABX51_06540 [Nanoarchaeota archaeon]